MHQSHETQELPTEATPESQQEADVEESQDDAESKQPLEQDEKMAE